MKILVVANLPPYVLGGAENQVERLVAAWTKLGHYVEVAAHKIPGGVHIINDAEIKTHHIAVFSKAGRGMRAVSYFFSLTRLLRKISRNFDIVYCRGLGDGAISICLMKAFGWIRIPLVACPINAKGAGDAHFIRSIPGWPLLITLINHHCNAINIIAPAIESDLIELGIKGPIISRIPNGISLRDPVRRLLTPQVRRLLWVGRLSRQKGLDLLFAALGRIVSEREDFSLEIIGEGEELAPLMRQCRGHGLVGRVHFSGVVAKDDVRAKLKEADVFVLPSRYEGMSNAALEAMEAGLPLLITQCGGIDYYVDDSIGWVCAPNDIEALSNAIIQMLNTPADVLSKMGQQARKLAESKFEISAIGKKNAELMEQVLAASVKRSF